METKPDPKTSMPVVINLYDWHTKFYKNAIDGISDKDAQNRLNTKANHVAWIAGSVVHERYALAKFLNVNKQQTSHELFKDHKGIQDNVTYPPLSEYKKDWDEISPVLRDALIHAGIDQLNGPDPYEMPGGPFTFFDSIVGCIDRESYCIGQLGLYRRLLGYEAIKYE